MIYKLQKRVLSVASDKAYQSLAHGRFSHGTLASSTTKTGSHDIADQYSIFFSLRKLYMGNMFACFAYITLMNL
jgi:hypothetical protein